jgi:hypothetical protein
MAGIGDGDGLYIGVSSTVEGSSGKKLKHDMPLKEIVGSGGFYNELQLGFQRKANDDRMGGKWYIGLYQNRNRNGEIGVSLATELEKQLIKNIPLNLLVGLGYGIGWQDSDDIDTSQGRIDFKGKTHIVHLDAFIGLSYYAAANVEVDLAYRLRYSAYKISYKYSGTNSYVYDAVGDVGNGVRLGVNFRF